jgi:hypothetical protein
MMPEPNNTPPEDKYVTADCKHEVYAGEPLIYWKNEKGNIVSLCPDCFWDKIKEMPIRELADRLDWDYTEVT